MFCCTLAESRNLPPGVQAVWTVRAVCGISYLALVRIIEGNRGVSRAALLHSLSYREPRLDVAASAANATHVERSSDCRVVLI